MRKKILILTVAIITAILIITIFYNSGAKELQGSWINSGITFTVSGKRFMASLPEGNYEGDFTVNKKNNPWEIDFMIEKAPDKNYEGQTIPAIYKLEDEVLTIVMKNAPLNAARPTSFTQEGIGIAKLAKE